jgi:hypothetical protein
LGQKLFSGESYIGKGIEEDIMIEIDIPRFGFVRLEQLVSDFTGALSVDGKLYTKKLKATLRF